MDRNRNTKDRPGERNRNHAEYGRANSNWGRDYGVGEDQDLQATARDDYAEMYDYVNQNFGRGGNTQGYPDYETGHTAEGFRGGYEIDGTEGSYHSGTREWQEDTTISDFRPAGSDDFSSGEAYFRRPRGPYSGQGPRGYRRPDQRIHEEACEALTHDPHVDASDIEVEVNQGTVVLKGHVASRNMKRKAELLIDDVWGIEDVRNELRISSAGNASKDRNEPVGSVEPGAQDAKPIESAGLRTTSKSGNSSTTTPELKNSEAGS